MRQLPEHKDYDKIDVTEVQQGALKILDKSSIQNPSSSDATDSTGSRCYTAVCLAARTGSSKDLHGGAPKEWINP